MQTLITRSRIGLLALSSALVLAGCGGAESRKAEHLERGKAYIAEKNWEKARLEFSNVLQIEDKNIEAHFLLGKAMEELGDLRGAAGHYIRTVELDPKHVEARIKAAQFLLVGGDEAGVREHVKELQKLAPENTGTLVLSGSLKARDQDLPGALADAEAALKADPDNSNGYALKSSVQLAMKDKDGALATAKIATERLPKEASLWVILATLHAERGEATEAGTAYSKLIELQPKDIAPRLALAKFYNQAGKLDEAEKTIRDAIAAFPDETDPKLGLIEFLVARRTPEVGEQELVKMIEADPSRTALRFGLGKLYEAGQQFDKAKTLYQEILAKDATGPDSLEAKNRLALLALRENDKETAIKLTDEVLKQNPQDRGALMTRGRMALQKGDAVSAINDFRAVQRDEPNSAEVLRLLAEAHLMNKEPQLAEDTLNRSLEANPQDVDARVRLAQILGQGGRGAASVELLQRGLQAIPNDLRLYEALVRSQVANKDVDGARKTIEELKTKFPDMPAVYHIAGLLEQADKKPEESIALFEEALSKAPDAAEPLSQLVKSYLAMNQPEKALERLQKTVTDNPKNFVAYNLMGEVHLTQKQLEPAKESFAKAIELEPRWPVPYRGLALTHFQLKDEANGIATFEKGIEASGSSIVLVTDLAAYYEGQKKIDQSVEVYEKYLTKAPESQPAANNLAMLLLDYRTDEASFKRAGELAAKLDTATNPAYLDTVGWAQFRQGQVDPAIATLLKAVEAAPSSGVLRYHLGMAYVAKGDKDRATEHLQRAVESEERYTGRDVAKAELEKLKQG